MKRWLNVATGGLGLLALGALAVALVALLFEGLQGAVRPASPVFPSPIETTPQPPPPPLPTPIWPTPSAAPVPPCVFEGRPAPVEPAYPLESYRFSEPRVVLTHPTAIGIAGWLPDGRLLIVRDVPGTGRQTIDVLDVQTGERITYAEREGNVGKPVWLPALKAVAYLTLAEKEGGEPPTGYRLELWISYGSPQQAERLTSDVWGSPAVDPDGQRLWYFLRSEPDRLQIYDAETRSIRAAPVDLTSLRYPKPGLEWAMRDRSPHFQMAWRPDGSQAVFYSQFWTFFLDAKTGRWCELDWGEYQSEGMQIPPWPLQAQWSPDGRYVAFVTTDSLEMPFRRTWLTILDVETGKRRILSPGPEIEPGQHYVSEVAWAANARQLVALALAEIVQGHPIQKLYLIDARTGDSRQVAPEYVFGGGATEGWQLAWLPDGRTLAVKCPVWLEAEPTIVEDRVCVLSVAYEP